mgnify:FL=1
MPLIKKWSDFLFSYLPKMKFLSQTFTYNLALVDNLLFTNGIYWEQIVVYIFSVYLTLLA